LGKLVGIDGGEIEIRPFERCAGEGEMTADAL
jgi:hypothetical protein